METTSLDIRQSTHRYRTDIQALRGLAIALVLLHHAKLLPWLKAGYLGVDIFFVVSGYLITGIIQRALLAGTFTFSGFYFRRAKRLLPAAYVTFIATALLSTLFLTRPEMRDFTWQLLGAVTFTGNIALWMQTGYFEGAANLKPLLHVWSLAIEEQYYLLLPAALVFTPRRYWKMGVLVVVVFSVALCLALLPTKPGAVFYLLPARAWELALGSLGVLALDGSKTGTWLARWFWPALTALLLVPFLPTGTAHPGLDALIVCAATLVVILRRHPVLNESLPARGLARLGDISYSLYLVHWPLLAFAANAWVSDVPAWVRVALALLSVVLAWALYRWVERPVRESDITISRQSLAMTLGASAAVVALGVGVNLADSIQSRMDYTGSRRANIGLSDRCEFGDHFDWRPECRNSDAPRIMVWGDSNAMHLVPAIVASSKDGVIQATKSTCGPLPGVSVFRAEGFYNRKWAEGCIQFNQSVLQSLSAAPSVEVIVLSSWFGQYLVGNTLLKSPRAFDENGTGAVTEIEGSEEIAVEQLSASIKAVRNLGKRVVVVAPPPMSTFDIGRCHELLANSKTFFGADTQTCEILVQRYRSRRQGVLTLLNRISQELDVAVVDLAGTLCRTERCATKLNGIILYRDDGHLSVDGSRELGRQIDLAGKLMAAAR